MTAAEPRDRGNVLPLVLVVAVVLSLVVAGVATYTTATLRYGQVVERRADELAAAEAGMQDALERLRIDRTLCGTDLGGSAVTVNDQFPAINGISVTATCQVVGGLLPGTNGWAIVVTGDAPGFTGLLLDLSGGGDPVIEGPLFVDDSNPSAAISGGSGSNSTTIKQGDLWYQNDACAGGPANPTSPLDVTFVRSDAETSELASDARLVFDPLSRGAYCSNAGWSDLFDSSGPPLHADLGALTPVTTAVTGTSESSPSCKVFEPGQYLTPPVLAANNYFKSGVYDFAFDTPLDLASNLVTMGHVTDDAGFPVLRENDAPDKCQAVRTNDSDTGAVLYVSGATTITLGADSALEISGVDVSDSEGTYRVALHRLGTPVVDDLIIDGDAGSGKNVAFDGLVWAPNSRIEIGAVPVDKDAAFRGGIVVGAFQGVVSNATDDGFLIRVAGSVANTNVRLESVAGGTTVVVIADWRTSPTQVAINSWRVCAASSC